MENLNWNSSGFWWRTLYLKFFGIPVIIMNSTPYIIVHYWVLYNVETYSHQFRTSYRHWYGSIYRTWYTWWSESSSNRYAQAKYIQSYDPSTYLMYDINNLWLDNMSTIAVSRFSIGRRGIGRQFMTIAKVRLGYVFKMDLKYSQPPWCAFRFTVLSDAREAIW